MDMEQQLEQSKGFLAQLRGTVVVDWDSQVNHWIHKLSQVSNFLTEEETERANDAKTQVQNDLAALKAVVDEFDAVLELFKQLFTMYVDEDRLDALPALVDVMPKLVKKSDEVSAAREKISESMDTFKEIVQELREKYGIEDDD